MFSVNKIKDKILIADSLPASGILGQLLLNTSDGKYYFYDGSAWQQLGAGGGGGGAAIVPTTFVIAASDSVDPNRADYKCNGTNDHEIIQQAIDALPFSGGGIVLLEGTYNLGDNIEVNKPCLFMGQSSATQIIGNGNYINFTEQAAVRDLKTTALTFKLNSSLGITLERIGSLVPGTQSHLVIGDLATCMMVKVSNCGFITSGFGFAPQVRIYSAADITFISDSFARGIMSAPNAINIYDTDLDTLNIFACNFLNTRYILTTINSNLSHVSISANTGTAGNFLYQDPTSSASDISITNNSLSLEQVGLVSPLLDRAIIANNAVQMTSPVYFYACDDSRDVIISNNVIKLIYPSSWYVIRLSGYYNKINNNKIDGAGTTPVGILETGAADWNDISFNTIIGCTTKINTVGLNTQVLYNLG